MLHAQHLHALVPVYILLTIPGSPLRNSPSLKITNFTRCILDVINQSSCCITGLQVADPLYTLTSQLQQAAKLSKPHAPSKTHVQCHFRHT